MLDGLLGRSSFKTKCKSALTRTKTRLEIIKKKRTAMLKFLKEDMAELLKNNHHYNAFERAGGLYTELNLSSCYDHVEECCNSIADHVKEMHKQSECPDEYKVATSSLIYAAAVFSDLPELRDLRNQFNDKYGTTLDTYVKKELVDKLKSKPPTKEMKLRLMEDIAREFFISWDPKSSELHHLQTSYTTAQDQNFIRSRSTTVRGQDSNDDEPTGLSHSRSSREAVSRKSKELQLYITKPKTPFFVSRSATKDNTIRKLLKQLHNSNSSSSITSDHEKAAKEGQTTHGFLVNNSKKESPRSERLSFSADVQITTSDLPLPPGRRRYLFPESQPAFVLKEANQFIDHL